MNIYMYWVSGKLDPGESLQSLSACLCKEFGPYGDAWEDGCKKMGDSFFPLTLTCS